MVELNINQLLALLGTVAADTALQWSQVRPGRERV